MGLQRQCGSCLFQVDDAGVLSVKDDDCSFVNCILSGDYSLKGDNITQIAPATFGPNVNGSGYL